MTARPDLLILDAADVVVSAAAALRHHGPAYPDDDRRRAGNLLRLAENRTRTARRRIEAGLDVPTDADRIVDRLIADGWLEATAALRPALVLAVDDELAQDLGGETLSPRRKETRP